MERSCSRRPDLARATVALLFLALACGGGREAIEKPARAPLVLVSLDGFRWDYAARAETPALDRLAEEGVQAERLIPVFPSKTFPSHYSIATGLYPGHHGILSNNLRDPRWPEPFRLSIREEVENARWWGGEPIWVTAARQGVASGVYFWPGSEAPVGGVRPRWWFPYDGSVPWETRVDAALGWLTLPAAERPAFVALYFEEPNESGHRFGPDAPEVTDAVRRADAILGRLLDGLAARGVEADVLVVSDHGMSATDLSRTIVLDELVELYADEVFETGAVGQIYPREGRETAIFAALEHAHPQLAVYRRGATPGRLHLDDNPRTPPILLVPSPGWELTTRGQRSRPDWRLVAGDHGWDPADPEMQGIFYAAGPGLARGRRLRAVEAVDLYALMCRLLAIEPAPNDGDWARVAPALR